MATTMNLAAIKQSPEVIKAIAREKALAYKREQDFNLWRATRRAEELAWIKEFEYENGLPQLHGTDKQVDWARRIRGNSLSSLFLSQRWQKIMMFQEQLPDWAQKPDEFWENIKPIGRAKYQIMAANFIIRQNQAAWWIENRNTLYLENPEACEDQAAYDRSVAGIFQWLNTYTEDTFTAMCTKPKIPSSN